MLSPFGRIADVTCENTKKNRDSLKPHAVTETVTETVTAPAVTVLLPSKPMTGRSWKTVTETVTETVTANWIMKKDLKLL